jgi:hypothetical protein
MNIYREGLDKPKPAAQPVRQPDTPSAQPVTPAVEPTGLLYRVKVLGAQNPAGKCDMVLTETGVVFQWKKPLIGKATRIDKPWAEVRDLRNRLGEKGLFEINVGTGNKDLILKVKVLEGDAATLSGRLDALPEETRLPKCPRCSGPVAQKVCKQCGQNVASAYRKKGLVAIVVGAALAAAGIIATLVSMDSARRGGTYTVWYGAVVVGLMAILGGIIKLIRGSR